MAEVDTPHQPQVCHLESAKTRPNECIPLDFAACQCATALKFAKPPIYARSIDGGSGPILARLGDPILTEFSLAAEGCQTRKCRHDQRDG